MSCPILMYHSFAPPRDSSDVPYWCPLWRLEEQVRGLQSSGYRFIPLARLADALRDDEPVPPRSIVLTIDDGLACALDAVYDVLIPMGVPATVFVVAGMVDGHAQWLRRPGLDDCRMLSTAELRALAAAGVDIGSHTMSHLRLADAAPERALSELMMSKAALEATLGRPVRHLAYPYGSYDSRTEQLALAAGYRSACSTHPGRNAPPARRFALERIEVQAADSARRLEWKVRLGSHDFPPMSLARRGARRALERLNLLPRTQS